MAYYCNENVKLRVGGRKAPKGGKEKLEELTYPNDPNNWDSKFRGFLLGEANWVDDANPKNTVNFDKLSSAFQKDISKYEVDMENSGEPEFGTTKSGVDYITAWIGGDWESPVQLFVYWDGKNYRGYMPTKGNSINLLNKSAFGNDKDEDNKYCQKEFGKDYDEIMDYIDIDMAACIEDFETRLEVEGVDPQPKQVKAAPKANEPKREYSVQLTTPDESLKLLKLGVSVLSADHLYHNPYSELRREIIYIDDDVETKETIQEVGEFNEKSDFIPAWSSSRMIELYLKNANTDVARVDYIVSGTTMNDMKDNIFSNLVKQLTKSK